VAHSNIMVTDQLDLTSLRMTVPLKHFDPTLSPPFPILDDVKGNKDNKFVDSFLSQTTTTYLLFPCTAISLFKRFALFLSIRPSHTIPVDDHDRPCHSTKSHVEAWATSHDRCRNEDPQLKRRDLESVLTGIEEDWECAEDIQHTLNSMFATRKNGDDAVEPKNAIQFSYERFCSPVFKTLSPADGICSLWE
jgi:hypothetical protein